MKFTHIRGGFLYRQKCAMTNFFLLDLIDFNK